MDSIQSYSNILSQLVKKIASRLYKSKFCGKIVVTICNYLIISIIERNYYRSI